jgi:putative hemolysin
MILELKEQTVLFSSGNFTVKVAEHYEEFEKALRLRFEVFNLELNEGLENSYETGMDRDAYDDYCDHLIVIDETCNKIVGTYRMLLGFVAENNIGYYSESEFDMSGIRALSGEKLELGRSCVHKDYRNSGIISMLWTGIARYIEFHNVKHLFGCSSAHTVNPEEISIISSYMNSFHRADDEYTVYPLNRLEGVRLCSILDQKAVFEKMPPLIKGYLRTGALVCGEPAYDEEFGTTDFFMLLNTEKLLCRYRRRYFQESVIS